MDRCALFVDASYALADDALADPGRQQQAAWDYAGLLKYLTDLARDRTGLPVLRCYWYESAASGRGAGEHEALASLPGVKLRLAPARPGPDGGAGDVLHRDLLTLARNRAVSDVVIVGARDDLGPVIADAQDLGVRALLVHLSSDAHRTAPRALRQECDEVVEIPAASLAPYAHRNAAAPAAGQAAGLMSQAAPGPAAAGVAGPAPGARNLAAVRPLGPAGRDHPPAGGGAGPAAPGLAAAAAGVAAEQQAGPRPAGGPPVSAAPGGPGQHAASPAALRPPGPGQDPLDPAGRPGREPGPRDRGPAGTGLPAQRHGRREQPPAAAAQGAPVPGPAAVGPGEAGGRGTGPASSQGLAGQEDDTDAMNRQRPYAGPAGPPGPGYGDPGQAAAGAGPAGSGGQNGPPPYGTAYHNGMTAAGPARNGLHQAGPLPGGPVPGGLHQGESLPGGNDPGGRYRGAAAPYQNGLGPAGPGQNGSGRAEPGGAAAARGDPGRWAGYGLPASPPPGYGPPPNGGPPARDPRIDPHDPLTAPRAPQHGTPYPAGDLPPPAGAGRGAPGHALPPAGPPARGLPPGGPPAAGPPAYRQRAEPPAAFALEDAVRAARAEGAGFGESVASDAPALWLEAVLARKPRMPSDLEARLLQGSALPIDSLLHDDVRQALRQGFWDALERSRR